jgi:hypothetical protein
MSLLSPEYTAGFFDGEGSITYQEAPYRRKGVLRGKMFHLRVTLANTNLEILEALRETYGGSVSSKWSTNPNARPTWTWFAAGPKAENFLSIVGPLLRIKQQQYQVACEFFAWKKTPKQERYEKLPGGRGTWKRTPETLEKEAEYKARLNELNRRGVLPN